MLAGGISAIATLSLSPAAQRRMDEPGPEAIAATAASGG